jgi:hypothetical protein
MKVISGSIERQIEPVKFVPSALARSSVSTGWVDGVSRLGSRYQRAGASGDLPTHKKCWFLANKWTELCAPLSKDR